MLLVNPLLNMKANKLRIILEKILVVTSIFQEINPVLLVRCCLSSRQNDIASSYSECCKMFVFSSFYLTSALVMIPHLNEMKLSINTSTPQLHDEKLKQRISYNKLFLLQILLFSVFLLYVLSLFDQFD